MSPSRQCIRRPGRVRGVTCAAFLLLPLLLLCCGVSTAQALEPPAFADALWRVLSLRDYNTRVVLVGTALLGLACGVAGSFMVLRKKALLGDAISHATLPGIALAFIVMVGLGGSGKSLPGLLAGAALTGLLGMGFILLIRHRTRLPEDAALGIVLSVFFGAGVALLGVIQKMDAGSAAGLESFIYGKTASMLAEDGRRIAIAAGGLVLLCAVLFKEFRVLCFDPEYARAQGWPVRGLDALMMGLVVLTTVIGLQAVGLILVIALLIIPAVAARFWTENLRSMVILAAGFGALSGMLGSGFSAVYPDLPAGGIIVLVASAIFAVSLLTGRSRGILHRLWARIRLERRIDRQHVLRAFIELGSSDRPALVLSTDALHRARHWSRLRLSSALRGLEREELALQVPGGWQLTADGLEEASRVVRNHRLWELYLIRYADVAASHVDRDADMIEHVLGRAMVAQLEEMLVARAPVAPVPESPHPILPEGGPS
ncbi:MAG TPA: iron chelate uptake ABC transporter family permease subunit [Kiritimatiellia bacterium]|nr:iron chelate uptake ABC transporter family permease subunit [Kiritimatiellia bacterium]